jgi:hypothetical protein
MEIRRVLHEPARLPVDVDTVSDDTDLFAGALAEVVG